MSESPEPDVRTGKKPYTKPAVARVPLIPSEAVLGACKSTSARGPVMGNCNFVLWCQTSGS